MKFDRLMALLLSIVMCMSLVPVSAEDTVQGLDEAAYYTAEHALFCLGVLDECTGIINPQAITRFEFVELMIALYKNAGISSADTASDFKDIHPGTAVASVVAQAEKIGLVHGDGNSNFRGDDAITLSEAMTIALNALGYNQIKDKLNSYARYLSIAYENDLDENVYARDGYMSFSDAYMLIFNMLNTDVLDVSSVSEKNGNVGVSYETVHGRTLMYSLFDLKCIEGVMIATDDMDILRDEQLAESYYELLTEQGDRVLLRSVSTKDYKHLIGMNVRAYYSEYAGGNKRDLHFVVENTGNNSYIDISGDDVIGYEYSSRKLKYYEQNIVSELETTSKECYEKIPMDVMMVYNSYYVASNKMVFDRINTAAERNGDLNIRNIRLMDNDGDNKVDVMIVNMYVDYLVDRNSSFNEVLDEYTKRKIHFNVDDEKNYVTDTAGNEIGYTSIVEGDILCVERDMKEEKIISAVVVRKSITGTATGKTDEFGYEIAINNNYYQIANMSVSEELYDSVNLGADYTVYFDVCGNIAAITSADETLHYGYILDSKMNPGLDTTVQLEMVVVDDSDEGYSLKIYNVKNKFKIDNDTKKAENYDFTSLESTLVRFKVNADEEITYFDTPAAERGVNEFSYANYSEKNGHITVGYYPVERMFFEKTPSGDVAANIRVLEGQTIILIVPKDKTVNDYQNRIAKINKLSDYFADGSEYKMNGYVLDEKGITCNIVLAYYEDGKTNASSILTRRRTMVVDNVASAINKEGKSAVLLEGMEMKIRAAYTTAGNSVINFDTGEAMNVVEGDVLQLSLNAKGDIEGVRRLYSIANDTYGHIKYSASPGTSPRVILGSAYSTDERAFAIVEKDSDYSWQFAETLMCHPQYMLYVYDVETGKARMGSYQDIVADPNSRIFVWYRTGVSMDVVVYKNWTKPSK